LTVCIILPVVKDGQAFRTALSAIAKASPAPDQVIIVTDGPAPEAARAAEAFGFRVVERANNGGPAAARNTAAAATDADVLIFVDADVAVHPDLVARAREALADPAVAAVVGCYDDRPPEQNFFSQYKNLLQRFVHLNAQREGSTFWGACGAIRLSAFVEIRGFDERFRTPSVEDIDLGYRLKAAGHRILFEPALQVTHLKRWTMRSLVHSDIFRRALPWTWLLLRESHVEPDLNLGHRSRLAGALSAGLAVSLAGMIIDLRAGWLALVAGLGLFLLDRPLWRFFRAQRGAAFATAGLVWHWAYYLYSVIGLAVGVLSYPFVGRTLVKARSDHDSRGAATSGPTLPQSRQ